MFVHIYSQGKTSLLSKRLNIYNIYIYMVSQSFDYVFVWAIYDSYNAVNEAVPVVMVS